MQAGRSEGDHEDNHKNNPKLVIILSGKRKSGKDHVAGILDRVIPQKVFLRISVPIKRMFTEMKGLDFKESLSASQYKESFRSEMITWSEEVRRKDPNVFLKSSIQEESAHNFAVWILVDARRECDLQFFQDNYSKKQSCRVISVRIVSSEETRRKRGWSFQSGVDDVESECGLDHISHWDLIVNNEYETTDCLLEQQLKPVIDAAVAATHQS